MGKVGSGLLMMVGAVVWFFGGLAFDIIFFYPPILFIIGLVTMCTGLFQGDDPSPEQLYAKYDQPQVGPPGSTPPAYGQQYPAQQYPQQGYPQSNPYGDQQRY